MIHPEIALKSSSPDKGKELTKLLKKQIKKKAWFNRADDWTHETGREALAAASKELSEINSMLS